MIIGVCLRIDNPEDFKRQVATFPDEGFTTCQLLAWKPELWTDEYAEEIKAELDRYGVTPSAFWSGWDGPAVWDFYDGPKTLGLVPPEYRERRVQQLCDGADFAKKLGITDVITHMGFIPENPNDPEFEPFCNAVRTVAEHCKSNGQYLLFEAGQETPTTMMRCFETVGTDNLGVNLDTANVILYGKSNPVDALDVFGTKIRNLHAKDGFYPTNGHDLGEETRVGDGKVDFEALIKKLHELGYDSHITIEREIDGDKQIEDIRYAKSYLQNIIDRVCTSK